MQSHGREHFRKLVYSSDREASFVQLPKVELPKEKHSDFGPIGFMDLGEPMGKTGSERKKEQVTDAEGIEPVDPEVFNHESVVITREPPQLLRSFVPVTRGERERYLPTRLLSGLLPASLLADYHFFRVDRAPAVGAEIELRGYSIREDTLNPHVMWVQTRETALVAFGTPAEGKGRTTQLCATVTKCYLSDDPATKRADLRLLNLLSDEQPGAGGGGGSANQLRSLAATLQRIEHLGHVLAWSEVDLRRGSGEASFTVDLVELHRQQLSFKARTVRQSGEKAVRLYSVEMPNLYIYSPPVVDGQPQWPPGILPLVEDIPHGLVMLSDTQELQLLLPNTKLIWRNGRLFTERDAGWDRSVQTSYFLFEVHVSKQFLITVSLVSALYLCMIRFLCEDYAACFEMLDSVATDRTFDMEERQIFQSIVEAGAATDDPNAAACLCKLALAVEDSPESVPNASSAAAVYVANSAAVHARCRLNQDEELKLIGMVRQEQLKKSAVKKVLAQSDESIVKQAANRTHAKGAQAKLVEELLRSVQEETTAAGVGVALTLTLILTLILTLTLTLTLTAWRPRRGSWPTRGAS